MFESLFLEEKVQNRRFTPANSPPPPNGEFPSSLASSRDPNIGRTFVFSLPSRRGLQRPSAHSNQTSNYSEFHRFNPFAPIFIGFQHWRKVFSSVFQKFWNSAAVNAPLYVDIGTSVHGIVGTIGAFVGSGAALTESNYLFILQIRISVSQILQRIFHRERI
ncbi:hypothetical protein AVEN_250480-1 [Araneus ventricosus]|uniref:Uncharacterized protein n=1 Tax=Araneus ventricosus TaxID=182803 RepID=A0A4Y2IH89_ARAVE|nr:hypothetical protein AVEN_250480-1 [Araneus ventricosus]